MIARYALPAAMLLALSGCGENGTPMPTEDPAKLSEELETEAREIERRAEAAVLEAEAQATTELEAARAAQREEAPATEPEPAPASQN